MSVTPPYARYMSAQTPAGGPLVEVPPDPEHDPRAAYALERDYVDNLTRRIVASSGSWNETTGGSVHVSLPCCEQRPVAATVSPVMTRRVVREAGFTSTRAPPDRVRAQRFAEMRLTVKPTV